MARDKLSHQFEKIKKSNSPEGPRFGRKTSRMGATGYFTHPQCMKHEMGAGHPECPERLSAIEDRLLVTGLDMALQRREAGPAALADIELAHGRMHVAALRGLSDNLRDDVAAGGPSHTALDSDTSINVHTWEAALLSAGAATATTGARRTTAGSSGDCTNSSAITAVANTSKKPSTHRCTTHQRQYSTIDSGDRSAERWACGARLSVSLAPFCWKYL